MDLFEKLIDPLVGREGGYVNHPSDRGGPTRWGVTEAVARKYGYTGDMRLLPRDEAVRILRSESWTGPKLHLVAERSAAVAEELFDTGTNMGPGTATKFLQRALNVMNRGGRDWPNIATDGQIGPGTLAALATALAKRGEAQLLKCLNVVQGARYVEICERDETQEDFFNGWLANRVGIPHG